MRLSHLEIFGFKSFFTKVEIPFGPGITAIVGPNGCGKSNIVEAIRWVMGEQRATAMRGTRMEDVIFSGTGQRKQLGMSEVSVTIDNSSHVLPIEYTDVTVTRRLFRSGDSDYLLNKMPCRLLDIQNLLMDTGLGPGAYSVMEQGMVDEIISEKTENRRRILEEAAGITKYKARRRSTWSKLESTNADLTRLEDIIAEVKRQVDYLGRQVGRARRYQKLKVELDELELLFGRYQLFTAQDELRPLRAEFAEITKASEAGLTRYTAREAELEKRRLAVTDAERELQAVNIELNQYVERIHDRDGELIATRGRREAREQFSARSRIERDGYIQQLESCRQQRAANDDSMRAAEVELESSRQQLEASQSAATDLERQYQESRSELDRSNRRLRELLRERSERSGSFERLQAQAAGLSMGAERMAQEKEQLHCESSSAERSVTEVSESLTQLRARLESIGGDREAARHRHDQVEATLTQLGSQRLELQRSVETDHARLNVLERVQSGYEGHSSGVRTLMVDAPCKERFAGVVSELIQVEPTYYRAVETALGDALEAVVAPDDGSTLEAVRFLKGGSGRAAIFPMSWQLEQDSPALSLPETSGLIGPLSSHVSAEPSMAPLLNRLLHNTFLVDDITVAIELGRTWAHRHRARFVTLEGDGVGVDGRVTAGQADDDDSGLLDRKREIGELKSHLAHRRARLTTLEQSLSGVDSRRAVLGDYLGEIETLLEGLKGEERDADHRHQTAQADFTRVSNRLDQIDEEVRLTWEQISPLEDAAVVEEERLAAFNREVSQLEELIQRQEQAVAAVELRRRDHLESLSALRVAAARVSEQTESLRRDGERLEHLQKSHEENRDRLEGELAAAEAERLELVGDEERMSGEISEMHTLREELTSKRDGRQQGWNEVMSRARELEEEISALQRELNADRERRHQLELRIAELDGDVSHIRNRLQDELQLDVDSFGPVTDEDFDPQQTEERLVKVRSSIQRMGPVHVGVLEEYEEQRERYDFLIQHRDDLLTAAEDLKKTLRLIDRTARRMFRDSFEEIRVKFRETFARFFSGGEADLRLQPDLDPLESPIDIIARPRGKRLQSIGLLSGGERALTAISLLFAIYQVKPSPYCILDEVDAPLDDANVDRFLEVLKQFAKTTQFIMVTHNKLSMGAADTLHGVTMPEEGVSQLVSVRIAEEMQDAAG